MAGDLGATQFADRRVADGSEHLVLGFAVGTQAVFDVLVDDVLEKRVADLGESPRYSQLCFPLFQPGLGGWFAVKSLVFVVDDLAVTFDADLGCVAKGTVFSLA